MGKKRFLLAFLAVVFMCGLAFANDASGIFDVETSASDAAVSQASQPTTTAEKPEEQAAVAPKAETPNEAKAAEPEKKNTEYKVAEGDNLWKIAERLLGDGARYNEIIEANKEKYPTLCKNPNLIHPDWVLTIPEKPMHIQPVQTHKIPLEPEIPTPTPVQPVLEEQGVSKPSDKPMHIQPVQTHKIPLEPEIPTPTPVKPILEVQDVNKPSSEELHAVNKELPNLTPEQKISRLQGAVTTANKALARQGKYISKLNPSTIRFLIKNGFMTEEEWMAMNPPVGYHYELQKSKVMLVKNKQEVISETPEAEKAKDRKPEKEPARRPDKELDKAANEQYQKFLSANGMKDYSGLRSSDYYSAILKGKKILPSGFLKNKSPYNGLNGVYDIYRLQNQLLKAQLHYEKMVDAGRTGRFLGLFGSDIKSAGAKTEKIKAALIKAYKRFDKAMSETKAKKSALQNELKTAEAELAELNKQMKDLEKYDSANASKLQSLLKKQKKSQKRVDSLHGQISKIDEVLAVFQM